MSNSEVIKKLDDVIIDCTKIGASGKVGLEDAFEGMILKQLKEIRSMLEEGKEVDGVKATNCRSQKNDKRKEG